MIINNAPQDQAVMSNVGQIGEFRIRNSAKAFSILSSGLYANKVRAIIRELSCNAIDSHVAAGNISTPFDIHLPNALEPWFSIRDYGTGLTADQVTSIYTTYFESTKTNSNEFIGALGLGSKSPFSYTDNFTVTAVQNGKKGVYTAFINETGVPSIALMMEEETTDPNGVEVKFAVEDRWDFDKFRQEARQVYKHFKQRPVVSGSNEFQFIDPVYKDKDIIAGVHSVDGQRTSYAIMGNIAYPIEIPHADKSLGDLVNLLGCGLVIEFAIGELDFQASREGLSYVPQTIQSIKDKLEALNAQLAIYLSVEADKIENLWNRAIYLRKRKDDTLWSTAVTTYVINTKFPLLDVTKNSWARTHVFELDTKVLAEKYNIVIRGFGKSSSAPTLNTLKPSQVYTATPVNGVRPVTEAWGIVVSNDVYFVLNDTKIGVLERAKYHWKTDVNVSKKTASVFVIDAADKTKKILYTEFVTDSLMSPPANQQLLASNLLMKDRASTMGKNVTILSLQDVNRSAWSNKSTSVWRDAGKADTFDVNETYYYLPLSGYQNLGVMPDVKVLNHHLKEAGVYHGTIYGVRKADMEWVATQSNWINLDTYIKDKLSKLGQSDVMGLVKQAIDFKALFQYNAHNKITNASSPYLTLYNTFKDVTGANPAVRTSLEILCAKYKVNTQTNINPSALIDKYLKEVKDMYQRYPLLKSLSSYNVDSKAVSEYINIIDSFKGV